MAVISPDLLPDGAQGAGAVPVQDGGNSLTVDATSWPLPTGAATAANQTTANTSLASIDTKTPTVGQKAMAASTPVVIASDQSDVQVELAFLHHQDAFSRLRASLPKTLIDCKMLVDNMPLVFDDSQVSGSGTSSTYNTNQASVTLAFAAFTGAPNALSLSQAN